MMNSKFSNLLCLFLCLTLVNAGKVTHTDNFIIITKAYDVNTVEKAIDWFTRGLDAKINVVEISGGDSWLTYVNTDVSVISYFLWGGEKIPEHVYNLWTSEHMDR